MTIDTLLPQIEILLLFINQSNLISIRTTIQATGSENEIMNLDYTYQDKSWLETSITYINVSKNNMCL